MARRIFRSSAVEEPVVNLTPLIDVVFVILIMFIVIAPLLELDRIELADAARDPMEGSVSVSENSPISIHVRKDNTIWFGKQKVNLKELTDMLVKAKARYPKAKPQLFHDKSAHFGTYQSVKNAAEAAGFEQMDVVLRPA